jgi:hypothetical protein
MEFFMAQRMTGWNAALGIAVLACSVSLAAQNPPPPAAAPDSTHATQPTKNAPAASPAPAEPKPVQAPQSLQKKRPSQEDILDEEELIIPEKGVDLPAKKAAAQNSATSPAAAQEKPQVPSAGGDTTRTHLDSAAGAAPPSAGAPHTVSPVTPAPAAEKPAPVVRIEDARPINFARNLKDYRSPKLAMLLSLVVPGLGQVYIGKGSNYVKAGAYVAVEAAIIGVSAYYFNKFDAKLGQAKNFANSNYSYTSMIDYYSNLYNFFKVNNGMPDDVAQSTLNDIYFDTLTDSTSSFARWYNFHNGQAHPTQDYYNSLQESKYMHGWKDVEPTLDEIGLVSQGDTIRNASYRYYYQRDTNSTSYLVNLIDRQTGMIVGGGDHQYGFSQEQRDYNALMTSANSFYRTGTYVLFCILLNHVVSAVDALISAKAYNDDLLGKQTMWQHIFLQPTTAFTGTSLSPGLTMNIRF